MTYKIPYWTAAAIAFGLFVWLGQGSNTAFAFADLVKQIVDCKTARYDAEFIVDGKVQSTEKHYYMAPIQTRTETESMVTIQDAKRIVSLSLEGKTASIMEIDNEQGIEPRLNMFEMFRDAIETPDASPYKIRELGKRKLGDIEAFCFRVDLSMEDGRKSQFTVWSDAETLFPLQIEMPLPAPAKSKVIYKNYEFDIELDEALFSTEIPEGYEVESVGSIKYVEE